MATDGREGGFIKLYRRLRSWPLWRSMSCAQRAVWIELLMSANWKDEEAWYGPKRYMVRRGQLAHSENTIAKAAKVGRKVVRDAIERLLSEGAIRREKSPLEGQAPWLITIVNYNQFQGNDDSEGQPEGQEGAKVGPSSGQGRALREEGEEAEEGKTALGSASAPPAKEAEKAVPAVEPFVLDTPPASRPADHARGAAAAAGHSKPKAADPLRRTLSDALVAVGREERNGSFAFDGVKDAQGVSRLLGWSRDVDDHVRRFRLALRSPPAEYGYRVDTIAAFATGRIWNHFATGASKAPLRLAPLGSPGT